VSKGDVGYAVFSAVQHATIDSAVCVVNSNGVVISSGDQQISGAVKPDGIYATFALLQSRMHKRSRLLRRKSCTL
jgi:hypothetical protein